MSKKTKKLTSVDVMKQLLSQASDSSSLAWLKTHSEAPLNGVDHVGHTALTVAASQGKLACTKWLLKHGSKLDHVQKNKHTALSAAIWGGHYETAKFLQAKGLRLSAGGRELLGENIGSNCTMTGPVRTVSDRLASP